MAHLPTRARWLHKAAPKKRDWSWRSQAFRGLIYQILTVILLVLAVWWLTSNTLENMRTRGIQSGFGFLRSRPDSTSANR
jgi:general L-amino acid transport system permease protein